MLQEAKDVQQGASDCAIDDNVHGREAENKVTQLKQDLFGAEQDTIETRETTKKYDTHYRETLVELERA